MSFINTDQKITHHPHLENTNCKKAGSTVEHKIICPVDPPENLGPNKNFRQENFDTKNVSKHKLLKHRKAIIKNI